MSDQRERLATATRTHNVIHEVLDECLDQDDKWGEQNHPDGTGPDLSVWNRLAMSSWHNSNRMLCQEARAECNVMHKLGRGTWQHILTEEWAEAIAESDPAKLRAELIQVAAVAVQWVEAIDRKKSDAVTAPSIDPEVWDAAVESAARALVTLLGMDWDDDDTDHEAATATAEACLSAALPAVVEAAKAEGAVHALEDAADDWNDEGEGVRFNALGDDLTPQGRVGKWLRERAATYRKGER